MSIPNILNQILEREGWPAYTEHPMDRGGATKGGITQRALENWRGRRCTRAELKRLTEEEALAILRRRYVEVQGINTLSDGDLQEQVIDDGVLSGPQTAVKDYNGPSGASSRLTVSSGRRRTPPLPASRRRLLDAAWL